MNKCEKCGMIIKGDYCPNCGWNNMTKGYRRYWVSER